MYVYIKSLWYIIQNVQLLILNEVLLQFLSKLSSHLHAYKYLDNRLLSEYQGNMPVRDLCAVKWTEPRNSTYVTRDQDDHSEISLNITGK